MFTTIFKKKITADQLATIVVNGILEGIEKGFEEVKSMIKDDKSFEQSPNLTHAKDGHFTMIVIVGNIKELELILLPEEQHAVEPLLFQKLSEVFQMDQEKLEEYYRSYSSFISRVNHPSKVTLYGMSKALFYKYQLNKYQDSFFKDTETPNPLFLKRMDTILKNFLWNWDVFFKRYKLIV